MEVKTMLILTRKLQEKIYINDNIEVAILGIYGKQIRIGITAPKEVSVHREEIWRRIQKEQAQEES